MLPVPLALQMALVGMHPMVQNVLAPSLGGSHIVLATFPGNVEVSLVAKDLIDENLKAKLLQIWCAAFLFGLLSIACGAVTQFVP